MPGSVRSGVQSRRFLPFCGCNALPPDCAVESSSPSWSSPEPSTFSTGWPVEGLGGKRLWARVCRHMVLYVDRATFRRLARNRQLRHLMASWTAFYTADLVHFSLAVVFTFQAGGAAGVGAATVL